MFIFVDQFKRKTEPKIAQDYDKKLCFIFIFTFDCAATCCEVNIIPVHQQVLQTPGQLKGGLEIDTFKSVAILDNKE